MKAACQVGHAAVQDIRPTSILGMCYHAQCRRGYIGVRSIVGRIMIEQLNYAGIFKCLFIDCMKGFMDTNVRNISDGTECLRREIGPEFVKGLMKENVFSTLINTLYALEVL